MRFSTEDRPRSMATIAIATARSIILEAVYHSPAAGIYSCANVNPPDHTKTDQLCQARRIAVNFSPEPQQQLPVFPQVPSRCPPRSLPKSKKPLFKISVAEYSLHRMIAKKELDPLDFGPFCKKKIRHRRSRILDGPIQRQSKKSAVHGRNA